MLADEIVEFGGGIVRFSGVAVGNHGDIDDIENRLVRLPQLCSHKLSAVGTQRFVVQSKVHFLIGPNVFFTLFKDLNPNERLWTIPPIKYSLTPQARAMSFDWHHCFEFVGHFNEAAA